MDLKPNSVIKIKMLMLHNGWTTTGLMLQILLTNTNWHIANSTAVHETHIVSGGPCPR